MQLWNFIINHVHKETWEGSASFSDYFYSGVYKLQQLQKTAIKLNETL